MDIDKNMEQRLLKRRAEQVLKKQAESDFELRFLLRELGELVDDVEDNNIRDRLVALIKRGESSLTG